MLTSIPLWAIIVAEFAHGWIWDLILTGLPSYFKLALNFRLEEVIPAKRFYINFYPMC